MTTVLSQFRRYRTVGYGNSQRAAGKINFVGFILECSNIICGTNNNNFDSAHLAEWIVIEMLTTCNDDIRSTVKHRPLHYGKFC